MASALCEEQSSLNPRCGNLGPALWQREKNLIGCCSAHTRPLSGVWRRHKSQGGLHSRTAYIIWWVSASSCYHARLEIRGLLPAYSRLT